MKTKTNWTRGKSEIAVVPAMPSELGRLSVNDAFTTEEIEEVMATQSEALAASTRRAYSSDMKHFTEWCASKNVDYKTGGPQLVAFYINALAKQNKAASTITRRLTSLSKAYKLAYLPDPTDNEHVHDVLKGIKRDPKIRVKPNKKTAVVDSKLLQMLAVTPDTLAGARDRAILLIGFGGAFRRSELAGIEVQHISIEDEGMDVLLPHSKTDQEGKGREVPVSRGDKGQCPVTALEEWLQKSKITSGRVFRRITKEGRIVGNGISDKTVALVIKRYAKLAGLDESKFAGHSLRSGLVTSAANEGASLGKIQDVTGHVSPETTMGYIHRADRWKGNAGRMVLRKKWDAANNP